MRIHAPGQDQYAGSVRGAECVVILLNAIYINLKLCLQKF